MTTIEAIRSIELAKDAITLFGKDEPEKVKRRLASIVHPDKVGPVLKDRANSAFIKMNLLWDSKNGKGHVTSAAVVIGTWVIGDKAGHGNIADIYSCVPAKGGDKAIFKICKSPKDNDLLQREYDSLKKLHSGKSASDSNFQKYLPTALGTLEASSRRANILSLSPDVSLDEIVRIKKDIDFRHVVWMVNRALSALAYIHSQNIVHGAVFPCHLLYGPVSHGLTLIDWCYSTSDKNYIPAIIPAYESLYPPEVLKKKIPTPATDIAMLFKSMSHLFKVPKRFQGLFEHCTAGSPNSRPQDAWQLRKKWLELAEEEYGPPKYIKLEIPTN